MVRDITDLLAEEEGDVGGALLDINGISFELFDAFGNELVVVNKRPKVSTRKKTNNVST